MRLIYQLLVRELVSLAGPSSCPLGAVIPWEAGVVFLILSVR